MSLHSPSVERVDRTQPCVFFFFCRQTSISTDLEHAYLSAVDQYHLTSNSKR